MKLPNVRALIVGREKIADYLLNPAHRYGASKARFFAEFGFRVEEWERLAQAFREHGLTQEVTRIRETGFDPHYEVEGPLPAPDGRLASASRRIPRLIPRASVGRTGTCSREAGKVRWLTLATDQHGRTINYLRVSLTDACNLRCVYCMPEQMAFRPGNALLQDDELLTLIGLFSELGFEKIRFTGGEPTLRRNLVELIRATAATPGI